MATGETVMCMPEHVCVPTVKHGLHVKGVETAATTKISCYNVLSIVIATTTQKDIDTFVWIYVSLYSMHVCVHEHNCGSGKNFVCIYA